MTKAKFLRKPKRVVKPQLPKGWAPCPGTDPALPEGERCGHAVRIPLCDGCRAEIDPHGIFGDE